MTTIGKELQHGFYETYIGTQTIPGCDCKPCEAGYKRRLEFQNSLSRFNPSSPRKQPKPTGSKFDGRDHGTWATYNAGCRCRPCTDAATEYQKTRRTATFYKKEQERFIALSEQEKEALRAKWRKYYAQNREAITANHRRNYVSRAGQAKTRNV